MRDEQWLLRYRYPDGRLQAALPLWRVDSDDDRRVGWLPIGSEISYWATQAGEDPRTIPLADRFTSPLTTARRTWHGRDVLRVMFRDRCYQVLHFFEAGEFVGWYVNFEEPGRWLTNAVETRDWHLDLCIDPDGVATWKDEEEATTALLRGQLLDEELDLARTTGASITADLSGWLASVGDWRSISPRSSWSPLTLPDGWDDGEGTDPVEVPRGAPQCTPKHSGWPAGLA